MLSKSPAWYCRYFVFMAATGLSAPVTGAVLIFFVQEHAYILSGVLSLLFGISVLMALIAMAYHEM